MTPDMVPSRGIAELWPCRDSRTRWFAYLGGFYLDGASERPDTPIRDR